MTTVLVCYSALMLPDTEMQHNDGKKAAAARSQHANTVASADVQQMRAQTLSTATQPQTTTLRRSTRKRKRTMTDEQYRAELKKIEEEGVESDADDGDYVPSESSTDIECAECGDVDVI